MPYAIKNIKKFELARENDLNKIKINDSNKNTIERNKDIFTELKEIKHNNLVSIIDIINCEKRSKIILV